MANDLYDVARAKFARAEIDWESDGFAVVLVDTGAYTLNVATHANLTHIPLVARVGSSIALANTVVDPNGACDADDVTLPNVSGTTAEALVIYRVGSTDADSDLIAFIDQATGLPITPNDGNIIIQWASTAAKIFRL